MAVAFILICADRAPDPSAWNEWTYPAGHAIAAQSIMLAAHALGLVSCAAISYAQTAFREMVRPWAA